MSNSNRVNRSGNNSSNNSGSKSVTNRLSNTFSSAKSLFSRNNSKSRGNSNGNSNLNLNTNLNTNSNNLRNNNLNNRNSGNSGNNKKSSSSSIFIIIIVVLLIVILCVAGYFIYRYMNSKKASELVTKQFIPYIHDASIQKRISNGSIPTSSSGNEYNINFWVYVNDYGVRRNEDKCILYKGEAPNGVLNDASITSTGSNPNVHCNPSVWLLKNENKMRVVIGLDSRFSENCDPSQTDQACQPGELDADFCEIDYFPLQKWVSVNITLRNNVIDIFFNGSLKKSCILKGPPMVTTGDMLVCPDGGFNGYVSNMKYSNKALSADKIMSMYESGPTL